jgi:hypothetical protein
MSIYRRNARMSARLAEKPCDLSVEIMSATMSIPIVGAAIARGGVFGVGPTLALLILCLVVRSIIVTVGSRSRAGC